MRATWLAVVALGCAQTTELTALPPDAVELQGCEDFDPVVAGEEGDLKLRIANYNDVDIQVEHFGVTGPFSVPDEIVPVKIPGGFGYDFTVVFAPRQPGPHEGMLTLLLDVPPDELPCALRGEAR